MGIIGIDHVQLAMPAGQEAEAVAFYDDLLGFDPGDQAPGAGGAGRLLVRVADGQGAPRASSADFRPARKAHPALLVDDLAALADRLTAAGIEVRDENGLEGYAAALRRRPLRQSHRAAPTPLLSPAPPRPTSRWVHRRPAVPS